MTNMQAALGLAQCEQLPAFLEKKRDMGAFYQKKLHFLTPLGYRLPAAQAPYARNCYWVFGIVAPSGEEKNRITACLHSQKIGTRPFFWCLHEQPVLMKERLFEGQRYPVAEELARKGFYIPSGLGLKKSEMRDVVHAISTFTGAKQP
jgi:perosamine synthetase